MHWDSYFIQRQAMISSWQEAHGTGSDIKSAVLWVLFGLLVTLCLMVWV